ncbi:MAG: MFS transporter [Gemmatimonadaceae bacterium]
MTFSVVMYKRLGVSNTDIALYTSWLYLPWVVKPLWSPLVDLYATKRAWTLSMQLAVTFALGSVAFALGTPPFFALTLAVFWAMALASATHDIACDGFYMLALPERQQAAFVGIRSTFYRLAMITGQGAFVVLAGQLERHYAGDTRQAWSITFVALALLFGALALWHRVALPRPASDRRLATGAAATTVATTAATAPTTPVAAVAPSFFAIFSSFFAKPGIPVILAFLLLYRFAEAQLVKLVTPFLLDSRSVGGLGLSTSEVGIAYGTFGVLALTIGGLLGGWLISRLGLRRMLWICVLAIHLPDVVFVWLAWAQPANLALVSAAVAVEQFGYGFGFTAYLLYMIMISEGTHRTAHYAICTGIMALGMMLPGMFAGALQARLGYLHFFVWIMLSTLPGFVVAAFVRIDPAFGQRSA